jgi:hypothetical protein
MKKILALVALIAVFSFVACNDDESKFDNNTSFPQVDSEVENPILYNRFVGTWRINMYSPEWFDMRLTFYPDSTYNYTSWERTSSLYLKDSVTGKCLFDSNTGALYLYDFNPKDDKINDTLFLEKPFYSHDTLSLDYVYYTTFVNTGAPTQGVANIIFLRIE